MKQLGPAKAGLWPLRRVAATFSIILACAPGTPPSVPPPAAKLDVTMEEYRFVHPREVVRGRAVVEAVNRGAVVHEMVVARLPDDFTGDLSGKARPEDSQLLATIAHLFSRAPGASGVFALDLAPGRYAFFCFIVDPDGTQHYRKGMVSELVVS